MKEKESNFYCQIKCIPVDFSIDEWDKSFNICNEIGLNESETSEILEGNPCLKQCDDCINIVLDRQKRTRNFKTTTND